MAGHTFKSETDSEVIAHLLEESLSQIRDKVQAVVKFAIGWREHIPLLQFLAMEQYVEAGMIKPLIIGLPNDGCFISSDVLGFLQYTDRAIFLDNKDIAFITKKDSLQLYDSSGTAVSRVLHKLLGSSGQRTRAVTPTTL